ncbi:MAG: DNA polymerase I, partial [Pyrinomonadaceae bacterium]
SQAGAGTSTEQAADANFEIKNLSTLSEVESLVKTLHSSMTIALSVVTSSISADTQEAATIDSLRMAIVISISKASSQNADTKDADTKDADSKDRASDAMSVYSLDFNSFGNDAGAALKLLAYTLAKREVAKVVHDLKQTIGLLEPLGVTVDGVVDDTLLAAYLLDPTRSDEYPLTVLAHDYLGDTISKGISKGISIEITEADENTDLDSPRLSERAVLTLKLAAALRPLIRERGLEKVYREIELPLAPLLYRMERAGLRVDSQALKSLSTVFGEELGRLTAKIHELAGHEFNIGSPKQVGDVFEELNLITGRKTSTGRVSTSRAVLDELAQRYELPRLIIEYREIDKLKSVYADALPGQIGPDGRIHCQLNQTVAATGRLSSRNPNLQNIPIRTELGRRIRSAFIPAVGYKLIAADYSQLELRILAHIARDPVMLEAFQKGEDIHSRTARLVFGANTKSELKEKRRLAKIVNFAIAYAVEPFGLSQRVGITRKEAKKVIEDYFDTYAGVRRYMEETPERARETGYVRSIFGRIRPMPALNDRNGTIRARAEREAINMPIQGTASDIVKIAMLRVDHALQQQKLKARMIMQIHDELLVEAPESEVNEVIEILKTEMESAARLDVPLEVEIGVGANWMDAK